MRTTREHPQTNSNSERVHRWVKERLSIMVDQYGKPYTAHLPRIIQNNNVSPIAGTKVTPFELWFNRKPRILIDALVEQGCTDEELRKSLSSFSDQEMKQKHAEVLEARETKWKANAKARPGRELDLKVGDWVMVPVRRVGKLGTLPHYVGPLPHYARYISSCGPGSPAHVGQSEI